MNREEWLARCAMAYDVGLVTDARLKLMGRWLNVVIQEGHSRLSDLHNEGARKPHPSHWEKVDSFWNGVDGELARLERRNERMFHSPTDTNHARNTLATLDNDVDGYALIQLAAIFTHPCQTCATDRGAWWTRPDSCRHKFRREVEPSRPFASRPIDTIQAAVGQVHRHGKSVVRHRSL